MYSQSDVRSAASTAISGGQADMAALLARIFERPLRFGESDLARSLSHLGDGSRLRRVMNKLVKGALVQ